jgi:hypothetical protein
MNVRIVLAMLLGVGLSAGAQSRPALPNGLDERTRAAIESIADSLRAAGLPAEPLYAKAAEGKLKQATDAQIVNAVRALANRFRELRAGLGASLDVASMSAAATALSTGVSVSAIRDMRDASAGARDPGADLASALVTLTDLVGQRVSTASAVSAVQSLLARRATPEQYARLRIGVSEVIGSGRAPDQAARATTEAIVRTLPATAAVAPIKPPQSW